MDLLRERALPKGDALNTARIAGVMAAEADAGPDPPLPRPEPHLASTWSSPSRNEGVRIVATSRASDRTGVEMEALTAVSVAALTIYDMCKAVDKGMVIEGVKLLEKTKG